MIGWKTFEYKYNGIKITLDWWAKHFLCKKFKTTENYLLIQQLVQPFIETSVIIIGCFWDLKVPECYIIKNKDPQICSTCLAVETFQIHNKRFLKFD